MEKLRDATLEVPQTAVDSFGATNVLRNLSSTATSLSFVKAAVTRRNALIVVAQIGLLSGMRDQNKIKVYPDIASLVLANAYGQCWQYLNTST